MSIYIENTPENYKHGIFLYETADGGVGFEYPSDQSHDMGLTVLYMLLLGVAQRLMVQIVSLDVQANLTAAGQDAAPTPSEDAKDG